MSAIRLSSLLNYEIQHFNTSTYAIYFQLHGLCHANIVGVVSFSCLEREPFFPGNMQSWIPQHFHSPGYTSTVRPRPSREIKFSRTLSKFKDLSRRAKIHDLFKIVQTMLCVTLVRLLLDQPKFLQLVYLGGLHWKPPLASWIPSLNVIIIISQFFSLLALQNLIQYCQDNLHFDPTSK